MPGCRQILVRKSTVCGGHTKVPILIAGKKHTNTNTHKKTQTHTHTHTPPYTTLHPPTHKNLVRRARAANHGRPQRRHHAPKRVGHAPPEDGARANARHASRVVFLRASDYFGSSPTSHDSISISKLQLFTKKVLKKLLFVYFWLHFG